LYDRVESLASDCLSLLSIASARISRRAGEHVVHGENASLDGVAQQLSSMVSSITARLKILASNVKNRQYVKPSFNIADTLVVLGTSYSRELDCR
jgi:hypothetical protein